MADALRAASLFRTYREYFSIGAAITGRQIADESYAALISRHCNSITAENDMKPGLVLDREKTLAIGDNIHTAQDFSRMDKYLSFAHEHNIRIRYHVLCWHNQTPLWFFMENWEDVSFAKLQSGEPVPFASAEVMQQRQEAYIRDIMSHVNTCFPGVVYCWDVVNEAIDPEQGEAEGYRTRSPWYQTMGAAFILSAFRAARKYQTPGQQLFYNDYNCYHPEKTAAIVRLLQKLQAEDLVDGMGMQGHLMMDTPTIAECETAARTYAALGLCLQTTELDIHCPENTPEAQQALAEKYAAYFDMLLRLRREGIAINCATFWGVTDADSWLPGFRKTTSYPLLFSGDKQTKPAFDAVTAVPAKYAVIRMNQVGYAENLPQKLAVVSNEPVLVRDAAGSLVREFLPKPAPDAASGENVAMLDLGNLPAGTYTVTCGADTRTLIVAKQPWREVTNALTKGLYYQRCGTALEVQYAGQFVHPACHTRAARLWENQDTVLHIPGGWHDAGDYGKYVTPGAVAVGHMLYTWLLFPDGCGDALHIPETGNGTPDILNEARWELEWILKMQREDGAVYHKLTKNHFAPFIMPEEDTDQEYAAPISSLATADTAAVCALASRVYRAYDAAFADTLLAAAERSWAWLQAHPELIFENQSGIRTGQYGDRSDTDERFWAACELFAATSDAAYRAAAEALYSDDLHLTQFGWAEVSGMGALCCLFVLKEAAGPVLYDALKNVFLAGAEKALSTVQASGYETALTPEQYVWGSILPLMNNAIAMIAAHLLTGRTDMRDAALSQVHYALGMNALNLSFITGYGQKRILFPHHRPSGADGIAEPVPGLISGGPNARWNYGATKEILPDGTAPAKCHLDETPSADTNEIAIYWNTPTSFVFAFFNEQTLQNA